MTSHYNYQSDSNSVISEMAAIARSFAEEDAANEAAGNQWALENPEEAARIHALCEAAAKDYENSPEGKKAKVYWCR